MGVASRVYQHDHENTEIAYLSQNLLPIMRAYDRDDDEHIEKEMFFMLLDEPEVHDILMRFGTDIDDLLQLGNILFEDHTSKDAKDELRQWMTSAPSTALPEFISAFTKSNTTMGPPKIHFGEFFQSILRLR